MRRDEREAYHAAWRLAWPLILSNATVPLLGMVDSAVVGHLPDPRHLGAVGLGAVTFNALYFAFFSLRIGTTGLTAQALGAGDAKEVKVHLSRGLLLATVLGLAMIIMMLPIIAAANAIFEPGAGVAEGLENYLSIRLLAAPAALGNMVLLGWLLGVQDARAPLILLVTGNSLNMGLDVWFVFGIHLEVAGVAWATVIAEYMTLGLGLLIAIRYLQHHASLPAWDQLLNLVAIRRLIVVNADIFVRSLCLQASFIILFALGSREGDAILAANAVLLNLLNLAAFCLDGFAHAASTQVGHHYGAGDRAALRAAVRIGLVWSLGFGGLFSLGFLLAGGMVIDLLTDLHAVRLITRAYLGYMIALPMIAATAFLFDGVFAGATRTAEMRNGMIASLAIFLLALALLVPGLGNHGLWTAFLIFMAARGIWLAAVYRHLEQHEGFIRTPAPRGQALQH